MCRLKNLKFFINIKTILVFALTIFLGLFCNSIFGRHIFRYSIVETFTLAEAEAKLNKRVTATCFENSEPVKGIVTSYHREDSGQISVEIKWDNLIMGKFDKLNFNKEVYRVCIAGEAEDE